MWPTAIHSMIALNSVRRPTRLVTQATSGGDRQTTTAPKLINRPTALIVTLNPDADSAIIPAGAERAETDDKVAQRQRGEGRLVAPSTLLSVGVVPTILHAPLAYFRDFFFAVIAIRSTSSARQRRIARSVISE